MRIDPTERLLRAVYSAALYVLAPITVYHLIWRGFRQPTYFQRWNERYASYRQSPPGRTVWLHAVSVGEVNAAAPLVDALRRSRPDLRLLITTITPTGSARVEALWRGEVDHVYLPYDLPGAVSRFLVHHAPHAALIMETELWPNLLFACRDRGIPVFIVNGRLSERSLRGYRVLAPLVSRVVRTLRAIGAQSVADGERFVQLGALPAQVVDTGNLKFDVVVPEDLDAFARRCHGMRARRPTWIAASTHEEEEVAVVQMHRALRRMHPDILLLWAPRHPERFRHAADIARNSGFQVSTRSRAQFPGADDDVFVIDTLGELVGFYACADVAFVGGSLQAVGGHNLLEPAATSTAIVTGPHLHNFAEIARRLSDAEALRVGDDMQAVIGHIDRLLRDPDARTRMTTAAQSLVATGRGAVAKTMLMIGPALPAKDDGRSVTGDRWPAIGSGR